MSNLPFFSLFQLQISFSPFILQEIVMKEKGVNDSFFFFFWCLQFVLNYIHTFSNDKNKYAS